MGIGVGIGVGVSFGSSVPVLVDPLSALSLDTLSHDENIAQGTVIGTLSGMTLGSTLSLIDSAGAQYQLNGNDIEAGSTLTDHSALPSNVITVRETKVGSSNSPRDTNFTITVNNVAPVLSNLTVTPITETTATISIDTTDGDGTLYFVVVPTAATAPSAAQIVAGTDGSDNAATWADSIAVASIDTYTDGITGLTGAAVYDCYAVHYDASAAASNIATVEFTATVTSVGSPMGLLLGLTYAA